MIEGDKHLVEYITSFYKNLFGHRDNSTTSLNIENPKMIQEQYRDILINEFSLEEIKNVVFNMAHNKSHGPDGFTAEFYQHYWELVKYDLKALLDDFGNKKN